MDTPPAESWTVAEPKVPARERAAMSSVASEFEWRDDLVWREGRKAYGWVGQAPVWAGSRPCPAGVETLVGDRRLGLQVIYPEAFPVVPAVLFPTDPEVPLDRRTLSKWHVNGDGSLCLMQAAEDWQLGDTAAELVSKAIGWFIEYLLMEASEIEKMTESGILTDTKLDPILAKFGK